MGDEIVNVCGHSVRGLTILQVRELLEDAYSDRTRTDMDLVICRYANSNGFQTITRSRKKSLDTYATDLDDSSPAVVFTDMDQYAFTALK